MAAIVIEDIAGCAALHCFHFTDVLLCWRGPHHRCILQGGPHIGLVAGTFDVPRALAGVSLQEGEGAIGFLGHSIDVLVPGKFVVNADSEVFCCVSFLKYLAMDGVVVLYR